MTARIRGERGLGRRSLGEGGFTLVEMMIAAALTMVVVGAAVAIANNVQNVYSYELEDAAAQQEARFALDYITRTIAAGASNPYDIGGDIPITDSCGDMAPGFEIAADSIRVVSDVKPPNGLIAGPDGDCVDLREEGEDVTIALDAMNNVITREDIAIDAAAVPITDDLVTGLTFTYLDSTRATTANAASVAFVQVSVTVQSKARNPFTGDYATYTYDSEVRVRSR